MMYDHCASTVRASVMHITLTEKIKQTQTADDDPASIKILSKIRDFEIVVTI